MFYFSSLYKREIFYISQNLCVCLLFFLLLLLLTNNETLSWPQIRNFLVARYCLKYSFILHFSMYFSVCCFAFFAIETEICCSGCHLFSSTICSLFGWMFLMRDRERIQISNRFAMQRETNKAPFFRIMMAV